VKTLTVAALSLTLGLGLPTGAQVPANASPNTESRRTKNIVPEEMWKRVKQCVFPTYAALVFSAQITGTVDIGLGISPEGDVGNYRVLSGHPLLVAPAVDAIRRWKFQPNVVQGEVTWTRIRALVRFNANGTTSVDLAPGILADNFGDPGTPRSSASEFPRPGTAPTCTVATQQSPIVKTGNDVSAFMQEYYLRPQPELIAGFIDALHPTGYLEKETAIPPLVAFFSEVFAANPERLSQWQVRIQKQDEQTQAALERAVSLSKAGGVLKLEGHSAQLNDMYWGAFFATGNPDYLSRLVGQLHYVDERNDFSLFMTGVSAEWSLASNAQSHILVRSTLETAKINSDRRTQELISELLAQGPARVKQEASEIIRKQREAGKWR
jgi:TonB family protein